MDKEIRSSDNQICRILLIIGIQYQILITGILGNKTQPRLEVKVDASEWSLNVYEFTMC